MSKSDQDPSIFNEPHVKKGVFNADPSEAQADQTLEQSRQDDESAEQKIEHTVWDEPGFSAELNPDGPTDNITYSNWLHRRQADTSTAKTWLITFGIILAAGPWAILGTFFNGFINVEWAVPYAMAIVILGPVTEEIMKVALALYVVEKRPFLFKSAVQIVICALAGGLVFAAVENLLYIYVYVAESDLTPGFIMWRWTICVFLHAGCSFIASLGLLKIWRYAWTNQKKPPVSPAYPYLIAAVVIHSAYNTFALILSFTGYSF